MADWQSRLEGGLRQGSSSVTCCKQALMMLCWQYCSTCCVLARAHGGGRAAYRGAVQAIGHVCGKVLTVALQEGSVHCSTAMSVSCACLGVIREASTDKHQVCTHAATAAHSAEPARTP